MLRQRDNFRFGQREYFRFFGLRYSFDKKEDRPCGGEEASTQFERATQKLGIKLIHAHSPQAKGRVERAFATLQDRLVKELRLFEEIFCLKTVRTILDGYLIRWKGRRFAIKEPTRRMLGRPATVMLHFDGRMVIRYEGRDLGYREIAERPKRVLAAPVVRPKPPKYIPPPAHPWKAYRDRFVEDLPERP